MPHAGPSTRNRKKSAPKNLKFKLNAHRTGRSLGLQLESVTGRSGQVRVRSVTEVDDSAEVQSPGRQTMRATGQVYYSTEVQSRHWQTMRAQGSLLLPVL